MVGIVEFLKISKDRESGGERTNRLLAYFFLYFTGTHVLGTVLELVNFETSTPIMLGGQLGGAIIYALAFWLCYKNKLSVALALFLIEMTCHIFIFVNHYGFLAGSVLGYLTVPVVMFLGHYHIRVKLAMMLFTILAFSGFAWYGLKVLPVEEIDIDKLMPMWLKTGVVVIGLLSYICYVFYKSVETAETNYIQEKAEVERQKEIVEEQKQEIVDSIHYAQRIQQAILPPDSLIKHHLPDSFFYFKPKDVVSGDFYWLEQVGDITLLAAADCTGHGVPGAMVSVVCVNALNRSVREFGLTQPAKILDKTRELVIETFEKSDHEVKDGMDISLCALGPVVGSSDSSESYRELQWAGANNPLYHIKKLDDEVNEKSTANETHYLSETKPDKQPIGKYAGEKPFTNNVIRLEKGDIIFLTSDGYPDQFGGPKGKKFKYKPFKNLLLSGYTKSLEKQMDILDTEFESWRGSLEQVDDVCIIGVKV